MAIVFSDYEDETVGTVPDGWTVVSTATRVEVTDQDPLEGTKSFVFEDDESGTAAVAEHSYGDDDVSFKFRWNDRPLAIRTRSMSFYARDSGGNTLWQYSFVDEGGDNQVEIKFFESFVTDEDTLATATTVATIDKDTIYDIIFDTVTDNLTLIIDGNTEHETGNAYTGASDFRIRIDDCQCYFDKGSTAVVDRVLMVTENLALENTDVQVDERAVVHNPEYGRGENSQVTGDRVILLSDELTQG